MNNKILLAVLLGLLAIFAATKFLADDKASTFDPEFIKVDSEATTKIVLHTKAEGQTEATLNKTDDGWTITKNGKTHQADAGAVQGLLSQMASVKTSFIAAKSADKWTEFELNADQASQVTVYGGSKVLADFYVGKFKFNQQAPQAQQVASFFRVAGKDDVYAVYGMAGMMLGQASDSYRNKQLLQLTVADIESLNFEGDKVYQVAKADGMWLLDGDAAIDTTKAKSFLMNLASMKGDSFVADFDENLNSDKLLKKLTINSSNMDVPVVVRCWKDEAAEKPFIIQSSQFPESYFSSDSTRLFTRLFKEVGEW